jgi:protein-S-isoprenylcysteine O-methyltransferase Ste14
MATPTKPEERGAEVHFPPPLVFLIAIVVGYLLQRLTVPLGVGSSTSMRTFGVAVAVAGVAVGGSAIALFRRTGQDPTPWKPSPSMIGQGAYRFSRNPMYIGMTLVQLGVGIVMNNLWIVLLALIALGVVHFIAVLPEERYLSGRFGVEYDKYRSRDRRYF